MNSENNKYLIVVTGPTGIGKSSLSNQLQQWLDTQIISADSRQIYKEMFIGTAKPSQEEIVSHNIRMVDCVSIHDYYSTGRYEKDAMNIITQGFEEHNIKLLVGGTGLYIEAIKNGIDAFPEVDHTVLDDLNSEFLESGIVPLQKELEKSDPKYYAAVDIHNARRLIRALSVIRSSHKPYSSFLRKEETIRPFEILEIVITDDREKVYKKINYRVDKMLEWGLEDEAKSLYPFKSLPSLNTVGYIELFSFFEGELTRGEAIEKIKMNTRRYAKRQMTWIRKHNGDEYIKPGDLDRAKSIINTRCQL